MAQFWILLSIPFIGTILGASVVLFIKNQIDKRFERILLGFAAGVMVAASIWSLLLPAFDLSNDSVVPSVIGLILGFGFMYLIDVLTPHTHPTDGRSEGPKSGLSESWKLMLALTIHNLPEGMAVGAALAASIHDPGTPGLLASSTLAVAIGMALQNLPEGAVVAMPMHVAGTSRWKSFMLGSLSGVVEPLGTLLIVWIGGQLVMALPYFLAFAAGTMLYVVVEELIPQGSFGDHSNLCTIGFGVGFIAMMVLDATLG